MPVKLGTFIYNLATKLGVDTTSPEFIELQSAALEVPDNVASSFQNLTLLTEESAKNNPKLKSYFTAQALNGSDARINSSMEELGFPEDFRNEIVGVHNTYDRISLLAKKAAELGNQKAAATGKEKESVANQYNAAMQELANQKKLYEQQMVTKELEYADKMKTHILRGKLTSRKLDTSRFDLETMSDIAFNQLQKELATKGIKIKNENDVLKLKQAQDDALDYYENNQPYSVDQLIDSVLANNKLLAVNDQPTAAGNNGAMQNYNPATTPPNGKTAQPLTGMRSKLDKMAADYQLGSGNSVI